ncbi:MAG TPA: ABC transporter substrate-binding protein [Candidatus Paceibacterota bacterium]
MKNLIWIIVILVIIGGGWWFSQKPETPPAASEPIKIGMIAGLTGQYAAIGENYVKGAQLAVDELEQKDPNFNISLIIENDDFDPKKSLSAYEKLISIDKINALISETTPTIEAIYDRVVAEDIPVMQGGEQSSDPTDDNVIQIQPGNYPAEVALGEHIKNSKYKNIVAFVQNYPAMLRFFRGFETGYTDKLNQIPINIGDKDMRTHALKALQVKPDAIVFLMFPDDGALLLKEVDKLFSVGDKPKYVFDANFQAGFSNYKNILGDLKFLDGSIVGIVAQNISPDFISDYKQRWGIDPALGSEYGYDAVQVLIKNYDSDSKQWIINIKSVNIEGVSGVIRFDEVGVRIPEFKNTIIKNGEIVY